MTAFPHVLPHMESLSLCRAFEMLPVLHFGMVWMSVQSNKPKRCAAVYIHNQVNSTGSWTDHEVTV